MTDQQILQLYDHHERWLAAYPGTRREVCEPVVRIHNNFGSKDWVIHSRLTAADADAIIAREVAYFRAIGRPFEWKLYAHDNPPDLKARLSAHGFCIGADEAIMALPTAGSFATAPNHEVHRVDDEQRLADFVTVNRSAWPEDNDGWLEVVAAMVRERSERMSAYVAYAEGRPVAAARVDFPAHSPFAGLWGGATLEPYRRRGIYTALLAARAREAIKRGYRFLTIDAGEMSRPIAAKHGFRLLTISNPCDSPE